MVVNRGLSPTSGGQHIPWLVAPFLHLSARSGELSPASSRLSDPSSRFASLSDPIGRGPLLLRTRVIRLGLSG